MGARGPRKRPGGYRKDANPSGNGAMYPEGVPMDENGFVLEEAEVPEEVARTIPLDPASARVAKDHKQVLTRKADGQQFVKWSADSRIRYREVTRIHPLARVEFQMVEPHTDDNIPTRPVSTLRDYDALVRHIKETHWRGERRKHPTKYKWVVTDEQQPQWACGFIVFAPEPEDTVAPPQQQQPPPQQQNPYGYPPYGGYGYPPQAAPPPGGYGYGYPQPVPQYGYAQSAPPPQQQYQQPEPQHPPQAAPVPQPVMHSPDVVQGLLGHIQRLTDQVVDYRASAPPPQGPPPGPHAFLTQIPPQILVQLPPHVLAYFLGLPMMPPMPQQQQPPPMQQVQPASVPAPAAAPLPPPTSPIDVARDAMHTIRTMAAMGKEIARDFAPPDIEPEPEPVLNPNPDPESPYIVQDIGMSRIIKDRETGERVEGFDKFLMNTDKWGGLAKGFLKEIKDTLVERQDLQGKAAQQALDQAKQLAAIQREIAESQERIARAKASQAAIEAATRTLPQAPQSQPPQPPPPQSAVPQQLIVFPAQFTPQQPPSPPQPPQQEFVAIGVPVQQPSPFIPEPEPEPEEEEVRAQPVMRPILVHQPEPVAEPAPVETPPEATT